MTTQILERALREISAEGDSSSRSIAQAALKQWKEEIELKTGDWNAALLWGFLALFPGSWIIAWFDLPMRALIIPAVVGAALGVCFIQPWLDERKRAEIERLLKS